MKILKLLLEVEYDETVTDPERLAEALDHLLGTAYCTPGVLDEHGTPDIGEFEIVEDNKVSSKKKKLPPPNSYQPPYNYCERCGVAFTTFRDDMLCDPCVRIVTAKPKRRRAVVRKTRARSKR